MDQKEYDIYSEKLEKFFGRLDDGISQKLVDDVVKFYEEVIAYMKSSNEQGGPTQPGKFSLDNETMHILEDSLFKHFIEDIVNGKLSDLDTIRGIAKSLSKLRDLKYVRWYA